MDADVDLDPNPDAPLVAALIADLRADLHDAGYTADAVRGTDGVMGA